MTSFGNKLFTAFNDYVLPFSCRTGSLGAKCVVDRQDVDMEDWSIINKWMDKVINYILSAKLTTSLDYIQHGDITEELYSRTRPFIATLIVSLPSNNT